MEVHGIVCPKCGQFIFSRTRHDFRWCGCGEVAIDGGFDYMKVSYKGVPPEGATQVIPQTKQELYDDWNTHADKYGRLDKVQPMPPEEEPCPTPTSTATS